MSFNKQLIFDMLDTLQEVTELLLHQSDINTYLELLPVTHEFVVAIVEHIESNSSDTANVSSLLHRFFEMLQSDQIDESQIHEHLFATSNAIKCLVFSSIMHSETNLSKYIDLLIDAVKHDFCVIITSMDTPCGSPDFTSEIGAKLCSVGITTNLYDKWRASYCAVIEGSKLVAEELSSTHAVKCDCKLGNNEIQVKSVGFGKVDANRNCSIIINGKQRAVIGIGLSFVIFDKYSNKVLDSVCFNTYSNEIDCNRNGDSEFVKEFKHNNPGVTFITPCFPTLPNDNLSVNEKWIIENSINHAHIRANPQLPSAIRDYIDNDDGIVEVLTVPTSYIGTDGSRYFDNHNGKYVNTINGHRVTVGQPKNPKRTIFILGGCATLGIGVRDEGTFASRLQQLLNMNAEEQGFIVENYAFTLNGVAENNQLENILSALPVKPGDIVIGYGKGILSYNPKLDERPYKYGELFFDDAHFTETAHQLVADGLFETLKQNDYFVNSTKEKQLVQHKPRNNYGFSSEQYLQLLMYKKKLSDCYRSKCVDTDFVGAIVMNCNPFTLGHRYLIEECSKRVDKLIVFVVQEDKSVFPFADRIALVERGVMDLSNVIVIESGSFIISTLTFQEYFNKTKLQDKIIDSSNDVTIFANEIAPSANIKIRFVGSEPYDKVTNQYNMTLARILPLYGVSFEEIPRKEINGDVISASKVRGT